MTQITASSFLARASSKIEAGSLLKSLVTAMGEKTGAKGAFKSTGTDEGQLKLASPLTAKQLAAIKLISKGKKVFPDKEGFKGNYLKVESTLKEGVTFMNVNCH